MSDTEESEGSFGLLFLAVLIDLMGFGIIIPILPFLAKDINPNQAGLLVAMLLAGYSLAQFVSSPFWGRLSDRIGRRPVILIGVFGSSISFAMFALVTPYYLLLTSRVIGGLFTGATLPTARAYIADITPIDERAKRFGLLGAAFGIGFTFGPAIGSLLSYDFFHISGLPLQAPASLFAAGLALINFLMAYTRLPESLHGTDGQIDFEEVSPISTLKSAMELNTYKLVGLLLVAFGLTTMIFSAFESVLPLYANFIDNRITEDNIGFFFAVIGIVVAVVQSTVVGPTVDYLGESNTIIFAMVLETIGFFTLGIANSLGILILSIAPLTLGTALLNPTINSAISSRIPKSKQGSGLGINSSIGSLGRVIGPIYAGVLFDQISPGSPFIFGGIILLLLTVYCFRPLWSAEPPKDESTIESTDGQLYPDAEEISN